MEGIAQKSYAVTGAGSGIGRETALMLGRLGARVTAADINAAAASKTAEDIKGLGGQAIGVAADVSNEAHVQNMVAEAVSAFGALNGAANCAGVPNHRKPIDQLTLDEWNSVVNVNLTGAFLCVKYAAAAIMATGQPGSIVVISSAAAWKAYPALSEYGASKAGIGGLIRCAAADLAPHDIRVNAVLPGRVETGMYRAFRDEASASEGQLAAQQLVRHMGQPAEQAAAIVWLLSDQSSFVTAAEFPIDGGLTVG